MLATDAKLLVVHRRLFSDDHDRYFVGRVIAYEPGLAKVRGYSYSRDPYGGIIRKQDQRTKILALASGTLMVYQLPDETDLDKVELRTGAEGVVLSDGKEVLMDLAEVPHRGGA